ncbi:DUF4402 domain-containing protein [Paraglaciecola polaris]|uniref:DUF4402 domain-containing protein n=1 Tax=Paraglaciecola polaris LMG 21857 TaxID=1129793 RepID=K6YRZ0_9ALTE|nr:DUF4402 domain-containing protein [Paraglaciecola polaris]GAC35489.1 hypothetical protein GPLA_4615 [Paraglaciecola polaris LMG 21857]
MDNLSVCCSQFFLNTIRTALKLGTLLILFQRCALSEIIFEENLDFGKFSIVNNADVSTLTVTRHGQAFSSNSLRIITTGEPASVRFFNYPPYTTLYLSAITPVTGQVQSGISAEFILIDLDIPASITTDSAGEASLTLGGTIESSGTGQSYLDTDFIFDIRFTINY